MSRKIYEKLPINEAIRQVEDLFPIGKTTIIHLNEKFSNGSPAIVIGHLIDKESIEKSIKLLEEIECTFQSICRIVVLKGKQKIVCYFDEVNEQITVFGSKIDSYNFEYYNNWIKIGKHIN